MHFDLSQRPLKLFCIDVANFAERWLVGPSLIRGAAFLSIVKTAVGAATRCREQVRWLMKHLSSKRLSGSGLSPSKDHQRGERVLLLAHTPTLNMSRTLS